MSSKKKRSKAPSTDSAQKKGSKCKIPDRNKGGVKVTLEMFQHWVKLAYRALSERPPEILGIPSHISPYARRQLVNHALSQLDRKHSYELYEMELRSLWEGNDKALKIQMFLVSMRGNFRKIQEEIQEHGRIITLDLLYPERMNRNSRARIYMSMLTENFDRGSMPHNFFQALFPELEKLPFEIWELKLKDLTIDQLGSVIKAGTGIALPYTTLWTIKNEFCPKKPNN